MEIKQLSKILCLTLLIQGQAILSQAQSVSNWEIGLKGTASATRTVNYASNIAPYFYTYGSTVDAGIVIKYVLNDRLQFQGEYGQGQLINTFDLFNLSTSVSHATRKEFGKLSYRWLSDIFSFSTKAVIWKQKLSLGVGLGISGYFFHDSQSRSPFEDYVSPIETANIDVGGKPAILSYVWYDIAAKSTATVNSVVYAEYPLSSNLSITGSVGLRSGLAPAVMSKIYYVTDFIDPPSPGYSNVREGISDNSGFISSLMISYKVF